MDSDSPGQRSDPRRTFRAASSDGDEEMEATRTPAHVIAVQEEPAGAAAAAGPSRGGWFSLKTTWVPAWPWVTDTSAAGATAGGASHSQDEADSTRFAEEEALMARETAAFHAEVTRLKALLKTLRTDLLIVRQRHDAYISSADVREAQELSEDMKVEVARVSRDALEARRRIDALHDATKELADDARLATLFPANVRMRTAIVQQLRARLRDVVKEFSELRGAIQREHREAVERRLFTVTGKLPLEEEVDRVVESGEADQLFRAALMDAQMVGAEELLRDARVRHLAFLDLERSLLELHQIYLDMATLVDAQGTEIDTIEQQIAKATEYAVGGTKALRETKKLHRKVQRRKLVVLLCCLAILVTAAVGITVGIVLKS